MKKNYDTVFFSNECHEHIHIQMVKDLNNESLEEDKHSIDLSVWSNSIWSELLVPKVEPSIMTKTYIEL